MNDMMEKFLKKQKPSEMSDDFKDAKKEALKSLIGEMSKMMAEPLKAGKMEQVTVAAKDKEGLQKGLEKAQELAGEDEESEPAAEEMQESPEEEVSEGEMSIEKIDEMIQKLEEMKKLKMAE